MSVARLSEAGPPEVVASASPSDEIVALLETLCRAVAVASAELRLADGTLVRHGEDGTRAGRLVARPLGLGGELGIVSLFDPHLRRLSVAQEACLSGYALALALAIGRRRDRAALARQDAERAVLAALVRAQAARLADARSTFECAARAARIGLWECRLSDERLTWTDGVYDLFEIPRGSALDRDATLRFYPPGSRETLEALRSRAVAEGGGFHLDTEIVTARGRRRWMRLTATVECVDGVPVRIFGLKQDITEEKIQAERTRHRAEFDGLTGLPNRSVFQARLADLDPARIGPAGPEAPFGVLLLIDLDGFKAVNDMFGHARGDACLTEAAGRLRNACRSGDFVARIGGDEFAVLLHAPIDPAGAEACAERIVAGIRTRIEGNGRAVRLGASVGIAWAGGCAAAELFDRADRALYAAKEAGRNTHRTFRHRMSGSAPLDVAAFV